MYHAKNPRKKQLRIRIVKCWYVTVENETETELDHDFVFGTREAAEECGQKMLKTMEQHIADAAKAFVTCPAATIFLGMNTIDERQKEMEKKCSPES